MKKSYIRIIRNDSFSKLDTKNTYYHICIDDDFLYLSILYLNPNLVVETQHCIESINHKFNYDEILSYFESRNIDVIKNFDENKAIQIRISNNDDISLNEFINYLDLLSRTMN